jgi:hypothetical protein
MNAIGLIFTLVSSAFLMALPRRLAVIPILMGALYMTLGQVLELGPLHFTVGQILVLVGILRVISKNERITGGLNGVDKVLIFWAIWLIASSVFHTSDAWVFRAGLVWKELGSYFLFRIFVQSDEDVRNIFKFMCVVLVPLAVMMLIEKGIGKNYFSILGGVREIPALRNGHLRAQGTFAHAILAGTVGATCFPMAVYLWHSYRKHAIMGLFASGGIIFASTSSGPILMLLFILFGMALYKVREYLLVIRGLTLTGIIILQAVMKDPVYFLMARIDISGGSQGWFRARLIQSSIEHLDEWWLAGTDYTRHWMATGMYANNIHVDITNHFLWIGVMGGLPLMLIFIMVLVAAFRRVGRVLRESEGATIEHSFLIWTLGAILFGHVWNFFSISLFDQSIVFLYLILASIGAIQIVQPIVDVEPKHLVGRFKQSRYLAVGLNKAKAVISNKQPCHSYSSEHLLLNGASSLIRRPI